MKNDTRSLAPLPSLGEHYSQLLGLVAPWTIRDVDLNVEKATLDIHVEEKGAGTFQCPECGTASAGYDHAPTRRWRHLDTMQFTTEIVARLPRISCAEHGVKTIAVPWAEGSSRWTLLFEAFAVEVMLCTSNITRAIALLKISWDSAQTIRARAVERGLARRGEETIPYVGIDEKSFLKGQKYVSLMTDLTGGRVLDVVEERTQESAESLIKTALSDTQRAEVRAVAMDIWRPFMTAWSETSNAPIVHDKFHIAAYLGKAVNAVRKTEHRTRMKAGDDLLKGAKYLFLKNDLTEDERERFRVLMKDELQVGRAWVLKETFRHFWDFVREGAARSFFSRWYFRATHSRLVPVIQVVKMLKRHIGGLLAHCAHKITNAVTEGLNSKIQSIKTSARGFRSFPHYAPTIILEEPV